MGRRRKRGADVHGVVLVDKPAGPTSHDVVGDLRRAFDTPRVGHTGTLDPAATGLLVVCIGDMTRFAERLTGLDKRYRGTLQLGATTRSDDAQGEVVTRQDVTPSHVAAARQALLDMTGPIEQRPPAVSAIRIDGKRAHARVRAGESVEIPTRQVEIYSLEIVDVSGTAIEFDAHVSKGTYIRSIARDAGARAGCGGHLSALRRTAVGPYAIDSAASLSVLRRPRRDAPPLSDAQEQTRRDACAAALVRPWDALASLPVLPLDDAQRLALRQGKRPALEGEADLTPPGEYRAAEADGRLLGVIRVVSGETPHLEVVRLCPPRLASES